MKNKKDDLVSVIVVGLLLTYVIVLMYLLNKSYEDRVSELKHTNKELMTSVEALYTQLNNAYNCDCGWYEDFYYEHSEEGGAYE